MESSNEIMVSCLGSQAGLGEGDLVAAGRFELEFLPEGQSEFIRFGIE